MAPSALALLLVLVIVTFVSYDHEPYTPRLQSCLSVSLRLSASLGISSTSYSYQSPFVKQSQYTSVHVDTWKHTHTRHDMPRVINMNTNESVSSVYKRERERERGRHVYVHVYVYRETERYVVGETQ